MNLILRPRFCPRTVLTALALVAATNAIAASPEEAPFLAENDIAMAKMMAASEIKPSGDVDGDFVAIWVPHHHGAIDMAQAELRFGRNEQLRRIAQEIIVRQQQEIAAMRLALGQPLPPSVPSPDQPYSLSPAGAQPMSHDMTHMRQEP